MASHPDEKVRHVDASPDIGVKEDNEHINTTSDVDSSDDFDDINDLLDEWENKEGEGYPSGGRTTTTNANAAQDLTSTMYLLRSRHFKVVAASQSGSDDEQANDGISSPAPDSAENNFFVVSDVARVPVYDSVVGRLRRAEWTNTNNTQAHVNKESCVAFFAEEEQARKALENEASIRNLLAEEEQARKALEACLWRLWNELVRHSFTEGAVQVLCFEEARARIRTARLLIDARESGFRKSIGNFERKYFTDLMSHERHHFNNIAFRAASSKSVSSTLSSCSLAEPKMKDAQQHTQHTPLTTPPRVVSEQRESCSAAAFEYTDSHPSAAQAKSTDDGRKVLGGASNDHSGEHQKNLHPNNDHKRDHRPLAQMPQVFGEKGGLAVHLSSKMGTKEKAQTCELLIQFFREDFGEKRGREEIMSTETIDWLRINDRLEEEEQTLRTLLLIRAEEEVRSRSGSTTPGQDSRPDSQTNRGSQHGGSGPSCACQFASKGFHRPTCHLRAE